MFVWCGDFGVLGCLYCCLLFVVLDSCLWGLFIFCFDVGFWLIVLFSAGMTFVSILCFDCLFIGV